MWNLRIVSRCFRKWQTKWKNTVIPLKSLKKKNAGLLNTYFKDLVCPIETSKLLLIVCKASSDEKYQKILQNDKSLLIETIFLLKMMHDTEKSNGSLHKKDSEIIEGSPINGFKCNLVRLIGNLTYRNKANQDEVWFLKIFIYYGPNFLNELKKATIVTGPPF